MYQYIENEDGKIGLHDCRTTHMSYENQSLSFDFPEGFYILNEGEPERSGMSKMKCHIIDEDIDGISIYIYRERSIRNGYSRGLDRQLYFRRK